MAIPFRMSLAIAISKLIPPRQGRKRSLENTPVPAPCKPSSRLFSGVTNERRPERSSQCKYSALSRTQPVLKVKFPPDSGVSVEGEDAIQKERTGYMGRFIKGTAQTLCCASTLFAISVLATPPTDDV